MVFRKQPVITDVESLLEQAMRLEAQGDLECTLPDLLRRSVQKSPDATFATMLANAVELEFSMRANLDDTLEEQIDRHAYQQPPFTTPTARDDIKTITEAFVPIWVMGGFDATGTEFDTLAGSDQIKADAAITSVLERGTDHVVSILWSTLSFSALADRQIDWDAS